MQRRHQLLAKNKESQTMSIRIHNLEHSFYSGRGSQGYVRLVYGACGCHKGQKAMAPVTCMLRVCTYSCAVIDCVVWDFVFKFKDMLCSGTFSIHHDCYYHHNTVHKTVQVRYNSLSRRHARFHVENLQRHDRFKVW